MNQNTDNSDVKKVVNFSKPKQKRKDTKVTNIIQKRENIYQSEHEVLYHLLTNCSTNTKISNETQQITKREILKKINSYKQQDINKKRYIETEFITYQETLEKLISSDLRCYYCQQPMQILYENVREKCQWTLDRIDNDICHSKNNLVVSCLGCNLQKRRRESEAFRFMKQMKIEKIQQEL